MIVQILISGFTQHRGYAHGWYQLREALLSQGFSSGVGQRVWLETWQVSTRRLADSIQILTSLYGNVRIGIYGYSYGGGYGALRLLRHLAKKKLGVEKLVMADPVFRPSWLPRPLPSPLSLLPFDIQPKIRLPKNINDLIHFYQNVNVPQSPYLITAAVTGCVEHRELNVPHQMVDDHPEVHRAVLKFANELRELSQQPSTLKIFRAA